ncbi:retinoic acid-induced protein 1 isoform X2 [Lepisosteus oculatus]|uniref:retinoic acid-induced protein 1 isoform X2 n=1 Tax=Lepisosteus oculatus TaxID=7918 RepID=UPI0035F52224
MQSFRERSGFHGNQQCYQQETHELSRLENYRHHHSQTRQGYEAHSLAAAGTKDCYSQQAYPAYGSGSAPADKQYKGTKLPGQLLPSGPSAGGYSGHLGSAYPAQYMSEGHLPQKWDDSAHSHLPQYEQELVGRLEPAAGGGPGGGQYLDQTLLPISQSQCAHPTQPNPPVYTTHPQAKLPQDTSPSPMTYTQGPMHFPQHSQSLSSSTPSYPAVEKCSQTPHCYKSYAMPPTSQYNRQLGSSSIKQSGYRAQGSYTYQQAPSRAGYEQQALSGAQDGLSKYQHFSQPPQNYCLSDISVRSPEQYYQNCSPSSSHSPARSVGRSPSYSSTPSPLMVNPESFQYSQPPITTGAASSSSSSASGLREQSLLMPPHSHASPSLNPQTASFAGSLKDRFSEKLLSNPSLWSLNALTSQVENISNNVQQLLLSEAMVANKKSSKRNQKKTEDFKGQLRALEDGSCPDAQLATPVPEPFGTPQSVHTELQEGEYSSSSEDQLERSYYYCGQSRSPAQPTTNSQHALETVSSCSATSPDILSTKSDDSAHSLPSAEAGENLATLLKSIGEEKSPKGALTPSPLKPEQDSPDDIQRLKDSLKENFEESAWLEKTGEEREEPKERLSVDGDGDGDGDGAAEIRAAEPDGWPDHDKYPSLFQKISKALAGKSYPSDMEEQIYQELQNQYVPDDGGSGEKPSSPSDFNCKTDMVSDVEAEIYKSEFPTDSDASGKTVPFSWSNDLVQDQYLTMKEDDSEFPHFDSRSELFEEKLSAAEREKQEAFEEQHSVLSSRATGAREGEDSSPSSEEAMNNKTWAQESGEIGSPAPEQVNRAAAATETQDAGFPSSERRSVICDISPSRQPAKAAFSGLNEEATPLSQVREHIDRHDAVVLEPDSPQLPGKSMLHSAPSWVDTPPSPKKGDEEIDPRIDGPTGVTPSTKAESPPPSAHLTPFHRKHAEDKSSQSGRIMHTSVRIRRLSSGVGEALPGTPQEMSMPSSKSMTVTDQTGVMHKDLSSQTTKLFPESFPSRMCTRSFTALAAPKACIHLKRQVAPKLAKGVAAKETLPKIKWKKQKGPKPALIGHLKGKKTLSESSSQDENHDSSLPPAAPGKDPRAMVLRSRKPAQEKPLKHKGKDKRTPCALPRKLKDTKKHKASFQKEAARGSPKQALAGSQRSVVYRIKPEEKASPPLKRKASCLSPVPVKKRRGGKAGRGDGFQAPLKNKPGGVKAPSKRLRQGEHLLTKDTPLAAVSGGHCLPPQYPPKTKYLPPRKGRGLKYEALVQKITSPGAKKHSSSPPGEPCAAQAAENRGPAEPAAGAPGEEGGAPNATGAPHVGFARAPTSKRKRVAAGEGVEPPEGPLESGGLVVPTPRLAKQRAIKNNHEMHLKQRRKKRKAPAFPPPDSAPAGQQALPPAPALPPSAGQLPGSPTGPSDTGAAKRGARRSAQTRQRQGRASDKPKAVKQTGPNRRNRKHLSAVKARRGGHRRPSAPVVEEKQPEIRLKYVTYKPQKNENKPFFSPYVHIDSSKEFAALCTIVNRPEEEFLLLNARKKSSAKMKSPAPVAKAIPNSSVMLQGPLVNKNLIDRCLTCCLCGKPANYRELGDLCGPYYPEDSIPRKTLSLKCKLEPREDRARLSCGAARSPPSRPEGDKGPSGSGSGAPGRPRRAERAAGEPGALRPKFRERYRKLQQFQGYDRRAAEGEAGPGKPKEALQRLELEAEAKEHWVHEACAVWTNGVFLVSGKLYGLQEAALGAAASRCLKCQDLGASVGCCSKGCPQKFHYVCAKEMGCSLQEENFSLKCPKHKSIAIHRLLKIQTAASGSEHLALCRLPPAGQTGNCAGERREEGSVKTS